jgi:peptide/nickel transport system substrate-binding protein
VDEGALTLGTAGRYWAWRVGFALLAVAIATLFPVFGIGSKTSSGAAVTKGGPRQGGTLFLVGTGDVDFMDPNVAYYNPTYLVLRAWSRQLYSYPATPGETTDVVPDLATAKPTVSANGLAYTISIRPGAEWDTSPPRQVTAADALRGLERTCNPVEPFGGLSDFESLILGMTQFCKSFEQVAPNFSAIRSFLETHSISGVRLDPSHPLTLTFDLTKPVSFFTSLLALPAFAPAPVEYLKYLPGSFALAEHTIADGPYRISSYTPNREITLTRNPAWSAKSDPLSKAYVDQIEINETVDPNVVQEELETNAPHADYEWGGTQVPPAQVPGLIAAHNQNLTLGPSFGLDPFLEFNVASPNNDDALSKTSIRQGIAYALNRSALVQDDDGPAVSPPLTHVLPSGIIGSQFSNLYPYNPAKARRLLAGTHLKLKMLYASDSQVQTRMFQTVQYELSQVGVSVTGIGLPIAELYTKYQEVPSVARSGVWDLSFSQWFPDWYNNNAVNFFQPLIDGSTLPPYTDDFGLFNSPTIDALISSGLTAKSKTEAANIWSQVDLDVMKAAAIYPIDSPALPYFHSSSVHNAVWIPEIQDFDPTNVWISRR